jgi:hypothetical protein
VYLIPALLIAALWLGAGVAAVIGHLAIGAHGASRWGLALLVLPVVSVIAGYGAADASRDHAATDWLARTLASAPPRAVLVSRNDGYTFALWYAHYVQGARPDLVVSDWDLWTFDWYRAGLARETGLALPQGVEVDEAFGDKPVCQLDATGAVSCVR